MVVYKLYFCFRLLQAEEEIENLKKVEPILRKELDTCQEVSPLTLFFLLIIIGIFTVILQWLVV